MGIGNWFKAVKRKALSVMREKAKERGTGNRKSVTGKLCFPKSRIPESEPRFLKEKKWQIKDSLWL